MPLHDKVNGRSLHLNIKDCQPCINIEKCYYKCWHQIWRVFMLKVALPLAVNDSMHASHPGKRVQEHLSNALKFCCCLMLVWHANMNQDIIYTLSVLCFKILCLAYLCDFYNSSFLRHVLHRYHCNAYYCRMSVSLEFIEWLNLNVLVEKKIHRYVFVFTFLGGQEEYVLSYEPVNQQEGL